MDELFKISAAAVAAAMAALVIKRGSAEMSLALTLAALGCCCVLLLGLMRPSVERIRQLISSSKLPPAIFSPVLKCVGIGIVSRIASDICRDGGQAALASAVELAGAAGAVLAALPLMSTLLEMMGSVP